MPAHSLTIPLTLSLCPHYTLSHHAVCLSCRLPLLLCITVSSPAISLSCAVWLCPLCTILGHLAMPSLTIYNENSKHDRSEHKTTYGSHPGIHTVIKYYVCPVSSLCVFFPSHLLTGYSRDSINLILCCTTLCILFQCFSLCHMGNGHLDLGHHMGVPKLLTWSIHSLGAHSHLEHTLTWRTYPTWRTITMLTILITSLLTIKCWLLHNKVFKLKAVYQNYGHGVGHGTGNTTVLIRLEEEISLLYYLDICRN